MTTAKNAFEQFTLEYSKLEVEMIEAKTAARKAFRDKKHVGSGGGFKPFQKGLQLLQQCSLHISEYSREQIELLAAFAKRLDCDHLNGHGKETFRSANSVTIEFGIDHWGYQTCKESYYERLGKSDLKTPARKALSEDMHKFFSSATTRLTVPTAGAGVGLAHETAPTIA